MPTEEVPETVLKAERRGAPVAAAVAARPDATRSGARGDRLLDRATRATRSVRGSRYAGLLLTVGVWLAGALVYFRAQWSSGFSRLMGNLGDARLAAYLSEHWFQVLHGQASWLNPGFFYPIKGLLGWSDTFFLYQFLYAPLRELGCDPFLALQLTVILLSLVGFTSFVYLVRRAFAAPWLIALAGGLAFTFSNNLYLHIGFYQLSGVYFVPLVALLGLMALEEAPVNSRRAIVYGCLFGILWALVLFSTYYVAVFATLTAAIVVVVTLLRRRGHALRWARDAFRQASQPLLAAVVGFVVAIIPFLLTYLPSRTRTGGLTYAEVLLRAANWKDLVSVGPGNVIWSGAVGSFPRDRTTEFTYAVTPVLAVLALGGGVLAMWWLRSRKAAVPRSASAAVVLAVTLVVLLLLPVKFQFGSLWVVVFHLPGVSVIRAPDRIGIVAALVAALAFVAVATEASKHLGRQPMTALRVAGVAVLALVVVEQLNTSPVSMINRQAQTTLLSSAPRPPAGCRSFYVVYRGPRRPPPFYAIQIDAMFIAQKLSIPTLNGYTAYNPKGWALELVHSDTYLTAVRAWETAHGLTGVCELNLASMQWTQSSP